MDPLGEQWSTTFHSGSAKWDSFTTGWPSNTCHFISPERYGLGFCTEKDSKNVSASSQITIDTDAECDEAGEAKITELNIPLVYDTLTFDMENLDKAFDTVIQGILVVLLETQNMLAVAALRAMIAQSVGSLKCS